MLFSYADFETEVGQTISKPDTEADYFFENVSIKTFDENGRNINQLNAEKIEHFKVKNNSIIESPNLVMHSESGALWRVKAESGEMNHQSNNISLKGEVAINQQTKDIDKSQLDNSTSTEIKTSNLEVNIALNTLSTSQNVSIDSEGIITTAEGLKADINREQIELNGKVSSKGKW